MTSHEIAFNAHMAKSILDNCILCAYGDMDEPIRDKVEAVAVLQHAGMYVLHNAIDELAEYYEARGLGLTAATARACNCINDPAITTAAPNRYK